MDNLIGQRILIKYFDQNNQFSSILPRRGEVVSRHKTENVDDWYLVKLDEPFEYHDRLNKNLLIRSRWDGESLHNKDTSVFIMLIKTARMAVPETININDYEQVAWGITELC